MIRLRALAILVCAALLASCANIASDFKFDPNKPNGVVIGSISFESGPGKYFLLVQPEGNGNRPVSLGFGCALFPCLEPLNDEAYSKGEQPKQRGGGYAVEVPEGNYRVVGWRVRVGSFHYFSKPPFSIPFQVERGKATYLGNLHFDGDWEDVKLRDRAGRDLPLLKAQYAALRSAPIAYGIAPGTEIGKLGTEYQRTMEITTPVFIPIKR